MPKSSLSLKEQMAFQAIAQRMWKKDPKGETVESGLIGQLNYWNAEKNFGFVRTGDGDRYYCHGSAFLTHCGVNDIVKFDVWEKLDLKADDEPEKARKAINVTAHQRGSTETATDEIGTVARWFGVWRKDVTEWKGVIEGAGGKTYRCNEDDFKEGWLSRGARVCFDIITDNWTGQSRAANIRSAKIVRQVHLSGVEGRVAKLADSYGFVSTMACDDDLHFNCRELTRVLMQRLQRNSRIICDVIMEEDGSLTAENVQRWTPATDTLKKAPVDEDCASTSTKAATDLPDDATSEPVTPEMRKLLKKLREIDALEGKQDLDRLEQAKVAMKDEFQRRLARLTA